MKKQSKATGRPLGPSDDWQGPEVGQEEKTNFVAQVIAFEEMWEKQNPGDGLGGLDGVWDWSYETELSDFDEGYRRGRRDGFFVGVLTTSLSASAFFFLASLWVS